MIDSEIVVKNFLKNITIVSNKLINECDDLVELERLRVVLVGKSGILTVLQKQVGQLIKEDRNNDDNRDDSQI